MGKVFLRVGMTLDGFIAPDGMDLEHADDPGCKDWLRRWTELQSWVFEQRFFRQTLQLGEGGETGRDNQVVEETFHRTGVSIMGRGCSTEGLASGPRKPHSIPPCPCSRTRFASRGSGPAAPPSTPSTTGPAGLAWLGPAHQGEEGDLPSGAGPIAHESASRSRSRQFSQLWPSRAST